MDIILIHIIGNFKINWLKLIFFREFLFLMRKIIIILIISFLKIGSPDTVTQNNAVFCMIICIFFYWVQIKYKPFVSKELNNLNSNGTLLMILTIFIGLFTSFSKDFTIQIILLIILFLCNFWFILKILKSYFILKLETSESSKFIDFFKHIAYKFWEKGNKYFSKK